MNSLERRIQDMEDRSHVGELIFVTRDGGVTYLDVQHQKLLNRDDLERLKRDGARLCLISIEHAEGVILHELGCAN